MPTPMQPQMPHAFSTLDFSLIRKHKLLPVVACVLLISACQLGPRANSPDALYSKDSSKARALQVPPDLSAVSAEEQFVLPGDGNAVISRNTLLPVVGAGKYVREGSRDWLELSATPEALWPRLLKFVEEEGFLVEATEPLSGSISTQWRAAGGESGSLAARAKGSEKVRLSLRLERLEEAAGSRLLARFEVASAVPDSSTLWSSAASNPENSSIVLQRFLAYLGINNQSARGLINSSVASTMLKAFELQQSEAGMTLVMHHGLKPSYDAIGVAIESLGLKVDSRASTPIAMNIADSKNRFGADAAQQYVLLLQPEHISKIIVDVANTDGTKVSQDLEIRILKELQSALSSAV